MLGGTGCSALDLGQVVGGPAVTGDEGRGLRELVESRAGSTGGIGPPGCPAGGVGAAAGGGIGRRGALDRKDRRKTPLRVSVKWRPARPLSSPHGAGRRGLDLLEMGLFSASGYLGCPMLIWAGNGLVLGWHDGFRSGVRRVARDSVFPHPPRPLRGGHRAGLLCPFCGVSNTTLPCRGVSRLAFRRPTPGPQDMLSQCFRAGSSSADCHWDTRFP